jgi:hypothetical protein
MPRSRNLFKRTDLIRALNAGKASGLPIVGYEIESETGNIIVRTSNNGEAPASRNAEEERNASLSENTQWRAL